MLRHIIRFESRLLSADSTTWWAAGIFVLAVVYALVHGVNERTHQRAAAEDVQAAQQQKWQTYRAEALSLQKKRAKEGEPLDKYTWGPRSPYTVGMYYGTTVIAETPPLAALAIGQRDLSPAAHRVVAGNTVALSPYEALTNPLELSVGHFDLAFVLLFLVPLLVLVLTFDLTTSERETGTLRMLLTQPVSLYSILQGKLLVRALWIVAAVSAASLIGFAVVGGFADGGLRAAVWLLATLFYAAFWFALAIIVNAGGRSAAANASVL
ncbi:MAG: ABC transporter permease, partial [Myxococcota bacterium]